MLSVVKYTEFKHTDGIFVNVHNLLYITEIKVYPATQKNASWHFPVNTVLLVPSSNHSDSYHQGLVFFVLELHKENMVSVIQSIFFCVWFPSLNSMAMRFFYVIVCSCNLFLFLPFIMNKTQLKNPLYNW